MVQSFTYSIKKESIMPKKTRFLFYLFSLPMLLNCSVENDNNLVSFLLFSLDEDRLYSSFALKGTVYDLQREQVENGEIRVVDGFIESSSTDSNGNFEAFVSQRLVNGSTKVKLEILQNNLVKENVTVPVSVDINNKRVTILPLESSQTKTTFQVENLGSTGSAISNPGELVAYYHNTGSVKDKLGNPIANVEVDLPNGTREKTDSSGNYKIPIIQTIQNNRNTLEFFYHKAEVVIKKMKMVVYIDTNTGETSIESITEENYGYTVDNLTTTTAIIIQTNEKENDDSDLPPTLSLNDSSFVLTQGRSVSINPTLSGGELISCESSPPLPEGLVLDEKVCSISGKPENLQGNSTTYTITASNPAGSASITLEIKVSPNSFVLTDTGLSFCFDNFSSIACGNVGFPNQDADYPDIPNAPNYTGPTQHPVYTSDYTTTDNVTGLLWKTCTEGLSGINCGTGSASSYTWTDAKTACTNLNYSNGGAGYAGKTNWRLPFIEELESLLNFGVVSPTIDTTYFPGTLPSHYWSSSTYIQSPTDAWTVFFNNGVSFWYAKSSGRYARCVSPPPEF